MAATLRVTADPAPGVTRIALLGLGEFGVGVTRLVAAREPASLVFTEAELDAVMAAGPGTTVVVSMWRPSVSLCERADKLAFRHQTAWLPVIAEHPFVRIGPLVDPSSGPCYQCYWRRRAQHETELELTKNLHAAYDADPGCGPAGYLPHHARITAAIVRGLLHGKVAVGVPAPGPGNVVTVGLQHDQIAVNPVIACHDCDRCGPGTAFRLPGELARLIATTMASPGALKKTVREPARTP